MSKIIMGVELNRRRQTSAEFQALLSEYGCVIGTRLGLHQTAEDRCEEKGLILLEFAEGADVQAAEFEERLRKIEGARSQKMVF